jgi:hypothetical protein
MNIFYLHEDPKICAQMHNDKHCVKMILEYAQLLSTAHRVLDGTEKIVKKYVHGSLPARWRKTKVWVLNDSREDVLYKATHISHPSAVWVRRSYANYIWLHQLLRHLCVEYSYRYNRTHKVEESGLLLNLHVPPEKLLATRTTTMFSEPTPAMPDEYKVPGDSIASYRNYYVGAKRAMSRWTDRIMPDWFLEGINKQYDQACFMTVNKRLGKVVSTSTQNMGQA